MIRKFAQLSCVLFLLCQVTAYSQPLSKDQLEQKVYQLNNEYKYTDSQKLLLNLLDDKSLSRDYHYQVAILLSYTYKRVFDYQAALRLLESAQNFARYSANPTAKLAVIQAEKAFIYFDINKYSQASKLMNRLGNTGFKHISLENKAKLLMQQGYLLFLAKKYKSSETTYNKAIRWMNASTPCHLPMIYVKKMQLYDAMNQLDSLDKMVRLSIQCANTYHILKYHLYTNEELLSIYMNRNDITHVKTTKRKLDSLNAVYKRDERLTALYNQKESILLNAKDQQVHHEQLISYRLLIVLAACILLISTLVYCLWLYNRRKRKAEDEYLKAKKELEIFLEKDQKSAHSLCNADQLKLLSHQQYKILTYITTGMSNKEIAAKLFISENTVKYHVKNIYQLLNVKDRKELLFNIGSTSKELPDKWKNELHTNTDLA